MLALIQLSLVIPLHFFIMRNFVAAFGLSASATSVAGHSIWPEMWVNGYGFTFSLAPLPYYFSISPSMLKVCFHRVGDASTCVRMPPNNSPVSSVTSDDIRYNVGGAKGVTGICTAPGTLQLSQALHPMSDKSF